MKNKYINIIIKFILVFIIIQFILPAVSVSASSTIVKESGKSTTNQSQNNNTGDLTSDSSFNDFTDLADLDIDMNEETGIVSIKQIEELKKDSHGAQKKTWNRFFKEYRGLLVGASGVCSLTFVLLFLITFFRIGKSSNNSVERSRAGTALLWLFIAAAGFGSLTLILSLAFGLLK